MLEIRLLGQFDVRLDGAEVKIGSRKAEALLAYLALNAGKSGRRERLAGLLWPEATEDNARTYVRQALWRIRKAIGEECLLADRATISFNTEAAYWLDVDALESEPADGWTVDNLIVAVSVCDGELLPGFYDDWVILQRDRCLALYNQRMEALLDALLAQSRWEDVLEWGERWIATGDAPEHAYRGLMRAHAALADLASMTAAYRRCVEVLRTELGVEPSEETQALFERLSQGDGPGAAAETTVFTSQEPMEEEVLPAYLTEEGLPALSQREPFIGREEELDTLEEKLHQACGGHGGVIFITGEAGRGKTTLLREFSLRAQTDHPDLIVASGACPIYTGAGAPYGPFREILAMLLGDVEAAWNAGKVGREGALRLWRLFPEALAALLQNGPHLLGSLVSIEGLMARARSASVGPQEMERLRALAGRLRDGARQLSEQVDLFAEYADFLIALSHRRPLLLVLDDLHWADRSSIGLLGHLGQRLSEGTLLLAGAYRPEEVNQGREGELHPLTPVLGEYKRRFGQVFIALDDAETDGGRSFVDALLDKEKNALGEAFRQTLTRHTNGHPLFTVELWREMQERGALVKDEEDQWVMRADFDWGLVPSRVEGVIETRINRLDQELRHWLDLAAVEGEAFTAEVIAHVSDVEGHVVVKRLSRELDRQHGLVSSQGVSRAGPQRLSRYQFRHNLFRQFLYNRLDDVERCYLHQQVGEALEHLFEPRTEEIADRLAHHFQTAGLAEKTITYLTKAGDNAADIYAYDEAQVYYEQALALVRELNGDRQNGERLTALFTRLGRILEHKADTEGALTVYREMESLGRSRADQRMILEALVAQGTLYSIPSPVHDPNSGQVISEKTLNLAQELGDRTAEARVLRNLMTAYGYDNQLKDAIKFGERSLVLAQELGHHRQLAFILNDLAGWYWVMGQIDRAKELFPEAAEIWRELGNLPMLADVLMQSSFASMFRGDYEEALALSDESWQISKSTGNKWNLAFSRSRIGFTHRVRGNLGLSIEVAEESLHLGETQELPNPQIFAGAELAFSYAYLGVTDLGVNTARTALVVADEKVPLYRPYVQAALAQNHLVNGNLNEAEATVHQAKSDAHWQAFPVLCIALTLADGRLALARADYERALQIGDRLLDQLRDFGMGSYLPEALSLSGQALSNLGRMEEARSRLREARREAEAMDAKGILWPILYHLSRLESEPEKVTRLRQKARKIVEFIADNTGRPSFRKSFLSLPEVQAVLESTD